MTTTKIEALLVIYELAVGEPESVLRDPIPVCNEEFSRLPCAHVEDGFDTLSDCQHELQESVDSFNRILDHDRPDLKTVGRCIEYSKE